MMSTADSRRLPVRRTLMVLAGALACAPGAWPQCPNDWLPGEGHPGVSGDGPVSAITTWDPDGAGPGAEVLVVAGGFEGAGDVAARRIATWDGSEWHSLGPGDPPGITGPVWALAVYNGDLIAAGPMNNAGGVPVNMIARFDGETWHPLGSGISPYPVRALAVYNGELYAGGLFTEAGGVAVNGIARWNGSTWQNVGSGLNAGAGVTEMTIFDGKLIVGGAFTSAGGVPATRFASWNGANWQSMDGVPVPGITFSAPDELAVYNGQLFAGGSVFLGIGFHRGISRWNGTAWEGLGPGNPTPNDFVSELIVYQGELWASGAFTGAGGVATPNHMARWNGSSWSAVPSGPGTPSRAVGAFAVYDGDLIAGGSASNFTADPESAIGRWDGSVWHHMGDGTIGFVLSVASFQGDLYVGGSFSQIGDISVSSIARRSADGTWDSMLGGVTGGVQVGPLVGRMLVYEDSLLVSGQFNFAGGTPVNSIARWDGKAWSAFGSDIARAPFVHDGELYALIIPAEGQQGQAGRWNPLTQDWEQLGVLPPLYFLRCFAVFNGDLIVGGASQSLASALRWNPQTQQWIPMGQSFGFLGIEALAVYNGDLYAGGQFDGQGGPDGGLIKWNPATSSWSLVGGGVFNDEVQDGPYGVSDLLVHDGELIVAGLITHVGQAFGLQANGIASWNGTSWSALGEGANDHVFDVASHDGGLALGGLFTMAGGTPNGHFARWGPLCPLGDIVQDGVVNINDLLAVINSWGACPAPCPPRCPADISPSPGGDCSVNINDLLTVLNNWG